jgi:signal transduction histidine kinase
VGVLMLGLSVLDGLEESERQTIKALAGFCAAAIDGSRRNSDERAASHMLNEVIAAAALKVHLVTRDDNLDAAHHRKLDDTFDLLNQCQLFVRNFRQIQATNVARSRIDLREVINSYRKTAKLADMLSNRNGDIEFKSFDNPLFAFASEQTLHMALHNLVVNSFEAMGDQGGKVRISLERATEPNPYQPNAEFAIIRVVDNGEGISAAEQLQMLDLFYSTKPDHIGAGLNIVEDIVNGFGGHLQILSPAPGKKSGTDASLWIPLSRKGGRKNGRA